MIDAERHLSVLPEAPMNYALPTLRIEGEDGLRLEPLIQSSPQEIYEYVQENPSFAGTVFWARGLKSPERAQRLLTAFEAQAETGDYLAFAIRESDGRMIGTSSIYQNYGKTLLEYSVAECRRGQGVATRATTRAIEYGVQHWDAVDKVGLEIAPSNVPSKAVARKLGARFIQLTAVDMGYGNLQQVEYWENDL